MEHRTDVVIYLTFVTAGARTPTTKRDRVGCRISVVKTERGATIRDRHINRLNLPKVVPLVSILSVITTNNKRDNLMAVSIHVVSRAVTSLLIIRVNCVADVDRSICLMVGATIAKGRRLKVTMANAVSEIIIV